MIDGLKLKVLNFCIAKNCLLVNEFFDFSTLKQFTLSVFQSGVLQCLVLLLPPTLKTLLQKRGLSGKGAALVPALNEVSPVVWR